MLKLYKILTILLLIILFPVTIYAIIGFLITHMIAYSVSNGECNVIEETEIKEYIKNLFTFK